LEIHPQLYVLLHHVGEAVNGYSSQRLQIIVKHLLALLFFFI
jgi:hypothetical protein